METEEILQDLNALACKAALEGARETRQLAALLAEEYRYRRDGAGAPVELAREAAALERLARLERLKGRSSFDWNGLEGSAAQLVPRGIFSRFIPPLTDAGRIRTVRLSRGGASSGELRLVVALDGRSVSRIMEETTTEFVARFAPLCAELGFALRCSVETEELTLILDPGEGRS